MIDNPRSPRVRAVAKLAKRSARTETGLFLLEGPQAVEEALGFRPDCLVELFATPRAMERHEQLIRSAGKHGVRVHEVAESVLAVMADTVTPQGVVAVARQQPASLDEVLAAAPRLLAVLEEVRDPGNLGTIIRAADAAGADAVLLTGNTVDPYNPKVVRSTTGSLFHVPIVSGLELPATITALSAAGLAVLAADIDGEELPTVRADGAIDGPTAWVFGNEAHGLPDRLVALADRSVRLPIYGRAESLNLATAASVCLYESAFAQRG